MNRFLVDPSALSAASPALSAENRRHLKVLRPREGEEFELFDGRGNFRRYAYLGGGLSATGEPMSQPAPRPVILFACVTKGSRWDWTLEKATELGATEIVPVISERTIVRIPKSERAAKRERWERIAADAARQCDTKYLPRIHPAADFADAIEKARECVCLVGALTEKTRMIAPAAREYASASKPLAVFVGPEGDFTGSELDRLCEIGIPVSFGANVLRAETAAIFALSVLRAAIDA